MKSVKLLDSSDISTQLKKLNLQRWLQTGQAETKSNLIDANNRGTRTKRPDSPTKTATLSEKTVIPKEQWTVEQLVQHSLSPAVSDPELKEYDRSVFPSQLWSLTTLVNSPSYSLPASSNIY